MTEIQTTLDSTVFGDDFRPRIERIEAIHERVWELYRALHAACPGEWQLVALDRPSHYATRAHHHVHNDRYHGFIEQAEISLDDAEQVAAGIIEDHEEAEGST